MALPKDAVPISQLPDDAIPIGEMPSDAVSIQETPQSAMERFKMVGRGLSQGVLGAGAIGVGASAIKKGMDYWQAPNKQLAPINAQLDTIKMQNPYMGNAMPEDMPSLMGRKIEEVRGSRAYDRTEINQRFSEGKKVLQQNLTKLDDGILNSNVEDLASMVHSESPKIIQDTYKAYGAGIDVADEWMSNQGIKIKSSDFKDMLQDVINKAEDAGVPKSTLDSILEGVSGETMTIKKAKGLKANIGKLLPREAQYALQDEWAKFLEKNVPAESSGMIKKINADFKPFVDIRKQISGARGDRAKIFNLIHDYAKNKSRMSKQAVEDLMKTLGEGTDLTPAIKGATEKFKTIKDIAGQRANIEKAISQIDISKQRNLQVVNLIKEKLDDMEMWRNKAEVLLSEKANIISKSPIRTQGLLKTLTGAGKVVGKLGRGMLYGMPEALVTPKVLEAIYGTSDPRLLIPTSKSAEEEAFKLFQQRNAA